MPGDMEAVISALEQARAALDEVEAAATQGRREKLKAPPAIEVEIEPKDDATEME